MFEYRITKYDCARRKGRIEDWTSVSDIGRAFGGVVLTEAAYQVVENAYVSTACSFVGECGVAGLRITYLENAEGYSEPGLHLRVGSFLSGEQLQRVFRLVLREAFWCMLEEPGLCFVHFGYDYYMYVGASKPCPSSLSFAARHGLFAERFQSPYKDVTNTFGTDE